MNKKLYKSRSNIFIDGVCGGIAEYFGIDPTLIRLAWILFMFAGGSGFVAYIICMIIIPRVPSAPPQDDSDYDPQRRPEDN